MGFFFGGTVATQDSIELIFDAQAAHDRHCESMNFVAHQHAPLAAKMIEYTLYPRIKHGCIEQVCLVACNEDAHDFMKMVRILFRQGILEQMLHAPSDMGVDYW